MFETTFGLVQTGYSLSKWKAVKLTFFAPCSLSVLLDAKGFVQYMHTEEFKGTKYNVVQKVKSERYCILEVFTL